MRNLDQFYAHVVRLLSVYTIVCLTYAVSNSRMKFFHVSILITIEDGWFHKLIYVLLIVREILVLSAVVVFLIIKT